MVAITLATALAQAVGVDFETPNGAATVMIRTRARRLLNRTDRRPVTVTGNRDRSPIRLPDAR